jgi:hypothetical protein
MEKNELDPLFSADAPLWDSAHLPAYYERWDGRRMIPNNYIDLFEADKDPFIEGLRSEDGDDARSEIDDQAC